MIVFRAARAFTLALTLAASVSGSLAIPAAAEPPATGPAVSIRSFAFAPQVVTVPVGATVTWTNADEDPHTVSATDKSFHSAALDTGGKYSYTFRRPGEFTYFCSLHPHMTGKVVVKG